MGAGGPYNNNIAPPLMYIEKYKIISMRVCNTIKKVSLQ